MLPRELRRLLPFVGPVVVLVFFITRLYDKSLVALPSFTSPSSDSKSKSPQKPGKQIGHPAAGYLEGRYHEIYSVSTSDKKYFPVKFDKQHSINPNAIPHPFLENTWIIVSQQQRSDVKTTVWFAELVCNAAFKDDTLSCIDPPMILPISKTPVRRFLPVKKG